MPEIVEIFVPQKNQEEDEEAVRIQVKRIPLHRDLSFVSNLLGALGAASDCSAGLRRVLCGLGCVAPVACGTIISVLFAIRTTRRSFTTFPLFGGGVVP